MVKFVALDKLYNISGSGVESYPKKIEVISQWPQLNSHKDVRSFLALAGCYRRFIKGYVIRNCHLLNY